MTLPSDVNEGINQALSNGADAIKAPVETVGNSGVSTSARVDAPEVSHVYLLSSEIVSLAEADRRTVAELEEVGR